MLAGEDLERTELRTFEVGVLTKGRTIILDTCVCRLVFNDGVKIDSGL